MLMTNKLTLPVESRMQGDLHVRFGGRLWETYHRKVVRRPSPSLRHHEENARPHKMMFYVWYSNKEKFYTTFDVTDQVHKAPDRKHVHIIIDNADFPEPLPDEGGFDVEVDDWVEVENDIIM